MYKYSPIFWLSLTEEDFNIETSFYKQLCFYNDNNNNRIELSLFYQLFRGIQLQLAKCGLSVAM